MMKPLMKLERVKLLALVSVAILYSAVGFAEFPTDTSDAVRKIGRDAGREAIDSSRGQADAASESSDPSFAATLAALQEKLKSEGVKPEQIKEELELRKQAQHWSERSQIPGKLDQGFSQLEEKQAKEEKKRNEDQMAAFSKTASSANSTINPSQFTPPASGSQDCTQGVPYASMQQEAKNFATGPVSKLDDGVQKVLGAKNKKAEKAAKQFLADAMEEAQKEVDKKEDPEIAELMKKPLKADGSELEAKKRMARLKAFNDKSRLDFTKAVLALTQKHGERLAANKANKALFGEITKEYANDWEQARQQFQNSARAAASQLYKNCLAVAEKAGVRTSNNSNQQGGMGGGMNPMMMSMMSGGGGGMNPMMMGGMGGMSQFAPGSSADLAMSMLTANYRGSLNFVPVVMMWGQMFQNQLNNIQCVDMTPQVDAIVGGGLQSQISRIGGVQDADVLRKGVKNINAAMGNAINQVAQLFDPNSGSAGENSCENALNIKNQFDQFGQGQRSMMMMGMMSQQGGGQQGGSFGAPQPSNHR